MSAEDDEGAADAPAARVLVMRTGHPTARVAALCGSFFRHFMRGLNANADVGPRVSVDEHDMTVRRHDDPLPHLKGRYHGVVITGSPAYVGDDEPWMRWGQKLVRSLVDDDVPLLAVCFGHQLVGKAFGADVGPNPYGREMGTVAIDVTNARAASDDVLWSQVPSSFLAQVTHRDVILAPGPHLQVLGTAAHDACHIVKAGRRQWGIQFHPEFDDITMRLYLEARRAQLEVDHGPFACERRIDAVKPTSEAAKILRRFALLAVDEARAGSTDDSMVPHG